MKHPHAHFHAPKLPDRLPVVVKIEPKHLSPRAGSGAGAGRAEKRAAEAGARGEFQTKAKL